MCRSLTRWPHWRISPVKQQTHQGTGSCENNKKPGHGTKTHMDGLTYRSLGCHQAQPASTYFQKYLAKGFWAFLVAVVGHEGELSARKQTSKDLEILTGWARWERWESSACRRSVQPTCWPALLPVTFSQHTHVQTLPSLKFRRTLSCYQNAQSFSVSLLVSNYLSFHA